MKHTNSQRTSSGRFGTADGPKARRIEVWLQPTTVELLDTLVEQWGVGRGKVIDQLITRGPVAPAAWAATQAEPTPSAPPEPAPAPTPAPTPSPTPSGQSVPAEGFPGPQNRKLWVSVRARFNPDGRLVSLTHDNGAGFGSVSREHPSTARNYRNNICPIFISGEDNTLSGLVVGSVVTFALNVDDGSIWSNGLLIAPKVAKAAWDEYRKANQLAPKPTPSGQFDFSPFCSPTPEPSDEEKAEQRRKHLQEMKLLQGRLDAIKSTDSTILDAIEDLCSKAEFSEKTALEFLLERWSDYHLKPRKRVNKGLWSDLQSLLPHFQAPQNLLFWAVVLRLPELNTEEMPTTSDRFLDWCSYNLFVEHRDRSTTNAWQNFDDLIQGRMTEEMARKALQLPEGVELTKKAIQDAYKTLAKQHHPDAGGDAGTFQRITEAKDRLLLTV